MNKEITEIKKVLKNVLIGNEKIDWVEKKWRLLPLLTTLETFDALFDNEAWHQAKNDLCDTFLLPWARRHYKSILWSKRNQAARIFLLNTKIEDFPLLSALLEDKSFFIRMETIASLSKIPEKEIIYKLLENMAKESPPARFPYRYALTRLPLESLFNVVEIYKNSEDEALRLVCLDIMSTLFITNTYEAIKKDYQSKNPQIKIFIVRILGNLSSDHAIADLLSFLKDPEDKVRSEAIISLGKLRSEKSFLQLTEMLHDRVFAVRLQAALALMKFGIKGKQILETQDWDLDPNAYAVARYVLTMP